MTQVTLRVKEILFLGALLVLTSDAQAQTPTPTPLFIPEQNVFEALATADSSLINAPPNIMSPDGVGILPAQNNALLFGYAKWLFSSVTGGELFGPFSPVVIVFAVNLSMNIVISAIYWIVYLVAYIVRWIAWFIRLIVEIIQAVAMIIESVVGRFVRFFGL